MGGVTQGTPDFHPKVTVAKVSATSWPIRCIFFLVLPRKIVVGLVHSFVLCFLGFFTFVASSLPPAANISVHQELLFPFVYLSTTATTVSTTFVVEPSSATNGRFKGAR
jgi:hypothetical protein